MVHTEIVSGDRRKLMVAPKGFGSENMSQVKLFPPAIGNQLTSQRLTDMGETCAFHCNLVEVQPQGN